MAKIGAKLKKLLGPESMARQFFVWNVLGETINAAAAPFFQHLTSTVNAIFPVVPLTPSDLAALVVHDRIDIGHGITEAKKSGISEEDFRLLVINATPQPAIADMLRLYREGKIPKGTLTQVMARSGFGDEWVPTFLKLGLQPPTPDAILEALLQGQTDEPTAHALYEKLGGDPDYFTLLYNTRGAAPTPVQAADMAVRGIIPWGGTGAGAVSFDQAFLEGPWRNKWRDAFKKAAEYLPPPDSIVEMLRIGALNKDQAADLLTKRGVPDNLIGFFLAKAVTAKTEKTKDLTESTIGTLYRDQAIDEPTTFAMLKALHYDDNEARFVLTTWRLARELTARNTAINTVHTQFINHKVDNQEASTLLDKFHVPAAQRDSLISIWIEERKAKVVDLTAAQIKSAFKKDIIDLEDALKRLTDLGYDRPTAEIYIQL
jgi:hypothetical protein